MFDKITKDLNLRFFAYKCVKGSSKKDLKPARADVV